MHVRVYVSQRTATTQISTYFVLMSGKKKASINKKLTVGGPLDAEIVKNLKNNFVVLKKRMHDYKIIELIYY